MEEKYWDRFMASGSVSDYLSYRGITGSKQAGNGSGVYPDAGCGVKSVEPDNSHGNGAIYHSDRGI